MEKFLKSYEKYIESKEKSSEQNFEEAFIYHLINDLGYNYNQEIKNENDLKNNFREKIEKLNNFKLTNEEFEKNWLEFNSGDVYERFRKNKSNFFVIQRNNEPQKTLYFFDSENINNNTFEVVNQMWVKNSNEEHRRFDVNILINGIPIIHVELKANGLDIRQASKQINKYKNEGSISSFLNFTKIYIISNISHTLYFSNNNEINNRFLFKWSDDKNIPYDDLLEFSKNFLSKEIIIDIISNFFVFNDNDRIVKICRPYQYHAVKKIIKLVSDKSLTDNKERSGYVWHATGSGKTLTSFKVCEILSKETEVKRVIFLVDRIDLNKQTFDEFESFTTSKNLVSQAHHSTDLLKLLLNRENENKIIISTIQKLNKVLSNKEYKEQLKIIKNEKIVFVVDECHRSQLGQMRRNIKNFFNNAINFAFTGTPIFDINSEGDGKTTENIFGKEIHRYISLNAINDDNVLPLLFTYYESKEIQNIENSEYDDIVEDNERKDVVVDKGRIKAIVNFIKENFDEVTFNRNYNAMLACSSINEAIEFYNIFKELTNLKVSIIFSTNNTHGMNSKITEEQKEFYSKIIKEYNSSFTIQDAYKFKSCIADDFKSKKERKIDLLIVVSMLLTGYDAPTMNTLFLDKKLEYHNLIQAISRTNRIYDSNKKVGQIISFRTSKEVLDKALDLYTNGGLNTPISEKWKIDEYKDLKKEFENQIMFFKDRYKDASNISRYVTKENMEEFLKDFVKLTNIFRKIKLMINFNWNDFSMTKSDYDKFLGAYNSEVEKGKDKNIIYKYNDYEIITIEKVSIDSHYLRSLFNQSLNYDGDIPDNLEEFSIYNKLKDDINSKVKNYNERELMLNFIKDKNFYISKTFSEINNLWKKYLEDKIENTENDAIQKWKANSKNIQSLIDEYTVKKRLDSEYITSELENYEINEFYDIDKLKEVEDTITTIITLKSMLREWKEA